MQYPMSGIINTPLKKSLARSVICLLAAALLWMAPGITAPILDEQADEYFSTTIKQAGIAYGTARLINASVSVVMESNLQVQPAGVGLSLAVGQVLDPLNDMAERLSDVLVMAIVSLGVQKLMYEISLSAVPLILACIFIVLAVLAFFPHSKLMLLQRLLLRFALLLLVFRFFLPLSAMLNAVIYQHFFIESITTSKDAIALESKSIQGLADFSQLQATTDQTQSESDGFWSQLMEARLLSDATDFIGQKSQQIKQAFLSKQQYTTQLIDHLLALTYLYVALFVIQVILLPLGLLYGLYRIAQLIKM